MPDKARTPSETLAQIRLNLAQHFDREELRTLCFDLGIEHENLPDAKDSMARELVAHCDRIQRIPELVRKCRELRPNASWAGLPARLFISYKRHADTDQRLAAYLCEFLITHGHDVFMDVTLRTGAAWLEEIDQRIKSSDFLIVLLSESSADSEMVQAELNRAYEYRQAQGYPHVLPVRIAYEGMLPYTIAAFLNIRQYSTWFSEADNERVGHDILAAIDSRLPERTPFQSQPTVDRVVISEDGRTVPDDESLRPPLPKSDPRFLKELEAPGGAVKLNNRFYIEREVDQQLKEQMARWGTTTTIRAPRQTGKTSLLMRGIHHAQAQGMHVVFLDFQGCGREQLTSYDVFLRGIAESICDEFDLNEQDVDQAWQGSRSTSFKLLRFMEKRILPALDKPMVLAMDEADCLLQTDFHKDFFGLLRSWHNRRATCQDWDKLNIVLVISTEPYLLIDDIHQSPFNVGLDLGLADFDEAQVRDLNQRHGSPVSSKDLPYLMTLLNGHPYLTRRALYALVAEHITWLQLVRDAPTDHGPFGDHLRHQYWRICDNPELKQALKEIISTHRCPDDKSLFRLLRAGLVKGSGNSCTCRCGLYESYFRDKLP